MSSRQRQCNVFPARSVNLQTSFMRNILLFLTAATMTITSCSKSSHNEPPDNGCIARVFIQLSDPSLTPAQTRTADSLLDVNHINHNNYRYLGMHQDSVNSHFNQYVMADQYANGLRLFTSQISYVFIDGILYYTSGASTKGTPLDTVPSLSLTRLRTLFSSDLKKREFKGSVTYGFRDSCYKAEFGYYNFAASNAPENLIKAWRVSIKYTGKGPLLGYPDDFPYAYYKDSNGELIGFLGNIIAID